ncbi:hypothetical protein GCM10020256_33980 [Streptomyces thermocoprophilus]
MFGVEPICRVLSGHGLKIATSTYYAAKNRAPSARAVRDAELKAHISRVHADNYGVYGVRKVWRQLHREGIAVARCTVARLMRELGLEGARRGKKIRTTVRGEGHERADDLLQRDFTASRPNERWVADFTYVATWSGIVYVAFVVDVFSRAIVGWSAATSKRAKLVLDALDMALWRRDRAGTPAGPGLVHHSDAGSQYTSFAFTAHLLEAGIDASVGTVGDALDNALMESQIGLYKNGADQALSALAWPRRCGTRHRGMGRLVQQPTAPQRDRRHPAPRIRDQLLRSTPAPTGGWSQHIEPPPIPERFTPPLTGARTPSDSAQDGFRPLLRLVVRSQPLQQPGRAGHGPQVLREGCGQPRGPRGDLPRR